VIEGGVENEKRGARRARRFSRRRAGGRADPPPTLTGVGLDVPDDRAGRAWINGQEVGGPDQRYSYLTRSHD
jgi:hypothetical protein